MGKFLKYELKGSYKFILGALALLLFLNTGNFLYIKKVAFGGNISGLGGTFLGISFLVIFGIMIGTFLYIINQLRRDLYEDRGYLTFTLPLNGRQIVASKVIGALIWFIVIGVGFVLTNIIAGFIIMPKELWSDLIRELSQLNIKISSLPWKFIIFNLISGLFNGLVILLTIYFSMALSRVSIGNRKFKGIWFFVFILLAIAIGYLQYKAIELVPYYIDFNNFGIRTINEILNGIPTGMVNMNTVFTTIDNHIFVNLGSMLLNIVIFVSMFLGTSAIIEKRIDL